MDRISILRKEPLTQRPSMGEGYYFLEEFHYRFYKDYMNKVNSPKLDMEKYAEAYFNAFSTLTPTISDKELIVGKCVFTLTDEEREEWKNILSPFAEKFTEGSAQGQDSHMAVDYDLVLNDGFNGIIKKIDGYLENCDEDKKAFYKTCRRSLEAVIALAEKYSAEATKLAQKEENSERRAELLEIARICRKVPANPAESFYEAVQSVFFTTYALMLHPYRINFQLFQLGRPDRYLYPFYAKDIESGKLTKEFAQLILDCLGVQINNLVPFGQSVGYMVGGRDKDGNIVQNDLTLMLMQVVDDVKLVYPSVGFCYAEGMDEKYLEKACEILSHGRSHPAIFNDDVITKGLMSYGVPESEAHEYTHSTCVEITPIAASNAWVASPYTNMPQLLLDILDREYSSFDELLKTYFDYLDKRIKENFEWKENTRKLRKEKSMFPLLSCLVNDCLARGTDIEQGGARYNWVMPSFVGVPMLVDCLYAIKEVVFDKKEITIKALKEILDKDFEGHEDLRLHLLNDIDKYGNDIDEIDGYFEKITGHIIEECKKYKGEILPNADLIPSVFCWVKHDDFGRVTGATPDGRKAGFPLSDGSGPCQGRELNGPTASILSSTKWPHHELIGGVAVNMKFSKNSLGKESVDVMKSLVKTFLKRGGFEMQINVVDKETLEKAIVNPEEYRDLVVRIGGYSDYFVKLSPTLQREVISRTEHEA